MSKERPPQDLKILQLAACPCTSSGIITFTSIVAHHPFINPHLYVVSNVVPKQWIIFAWKKRKKKSMKVLSIWKWSMNLKWTLTLIKRTRVIIDHPLQTFLGTFYTALPQHRHRRGTSTPVRNLSLLNLLSHVPTTVKEQTGSCFLAATTIAQLHG